MPAPLPFRWSRDGCADALAAAETLAAGVAAGGPFPAGVRVVKDRPMRVTAAVTLPGPRGPVAGGPVAGGPARQAGGSAPTSARNASSAAIRVR